MHLGHHGDGSVIPRRLVLFRSRNVFLHATTFALGFIGFYAGIVRGEIDDIHWSAATGFGTGQMLMLERLHKSMMGLPFLLCFHDVSLTLLSSSFLGGWVVLAQLRA